MSQIFGWLYVVAGVIFLFGAAVFVHEFGHYWVARKRGMKVEAFAIGFGPKIYGWTRDGIEYSLRWIPAGGFVKLPQMITSEALEGSRSESDESLPPASPFSKILVAVAGPLMNVVFAFVIAGFLFVVGLPVLRDPPVIGYVSPDSPEGKLGLQARDEIVVVDGQAVKSWREVQMATLISRTTNVTVVVQREQQQISFNLPTIVNTNLGWKMLDLDPLNHPKIESFTEPNGPAERAGLHTNDVIANFAGIPIATIEQLIEMIQKRKGEATAIVIERGEEKLSFSVTPNENGRILVALTGSAPSDYYIEHPNPFTLVSEVLDKTFKTLGALFHHKETGVGVKDLSGPPGIFIMLASQIRQDYRLALNFLVLLNVSLAFINLLPVPVLDGGHIMMSIVEGIRGRPLSARFMEYTTTAFAVLLISFMLYVSFQDLKPGRLRLFKTMFEGEIKIHEVEKAPGTTGTPTPATSSQP